MIKKRLLNFNMKAFFKKIEKKKVSWILLTQMTSTNSQVFKTKTQTQNSNMSGTGRWQRVERRPQQGQRNTFNRNRNNVEEQDGNRRPYRPYNRNNSGERRPFRPHNRNTGGERQGGNGRPYRQYNRNGNRRPYRQRNQQRRPQPKREVMAPNSIASWGLSKDKSFKTKVERASRSGEMISRETSNQFSALNQEEKRRKVIEGPTFGVRNSNIGAWGTKLAVEATDEPVKFKTLKEIEDEKYEREYEEELEKETSQMTVLPAFQNIAKDPRDWADMCDDEEEEDDEIVLDQYHAAAEIQQLDGWYD